LDVGRSSQNLAKNVENQNNDFSVDPVDTVPERFRPLVYLFRKKGSQQVSHIELAGLRNSVQGIIEHGADGIAAYMQAAENAGIATRKGQDLVLKPHLLEPMSSQSQPDFRELPYPLPILIQILEELASQGIDQPFQSHIALEFNRRAPGCDLEAAIQDAQRRDLVNLGKARLFSSTEEAHLVAGESGSINPSSPIIDRAEALVDRAPQATNPPLADPLSNVPDHFRPLVRLFWEKDSNKVHHLELISLRDSTPGLIERGKGGVAAYMRAAESAGIVTRSGPHLVIEPHLRKS
jgi:hypothetical protein